MLTDTGEDAAEEQTDGYELSFYSGGERTETGLSGFDEIENVGQQQMAENHAKRMGEGIGEDKAEVCSIRAGSGLDKGGAAMAYFGPK